MKKISTIGAIHLLLGANILLWLNIGTYRLFGDMIPIGIKFCMVVMWLAISFHRRGNFLSKFVTTSYLVLLFYILCLTTKLTGTDGYLSQYGMNLLYVLVVMAMFSYYYYYGTKKEIKFLMVVFLLDTAIIMVRTFIMLQENPEVVRLLSTGSDSKWIAFGDEVPVGIGAYGFCYQLVLLQPMIAYWFNKKQVNNLIRILVYGTILVFLYQAQVTLALLMYPVMLIISYNYGQQQNNSRVLVKWLLIGISMIVILCLPVILQALIESSGDSLAARLEELYRFVVLQDVSGSDMKSRIVLYTTSLFAFFRSPLWGGFGNKVYGSHSTLLDILAAFGVLGLIGYAGLFRPINCVRKVTDKNKDDIKKVIRTSMIGAIIISVINVFISSELVLMISIIIPMGIRYMADGKEDQTETISNQCNA